MAAVEVTITGMLYDKLARTTQNVVLIGEASLTGLGVGGGPLPGGPGQQPPVGGGQPPHPAFPIAGGPDPGWPDKPGYPPYVSGGPIVPPGQQPPSVPPHPAFPIWGPPGVTFPPGEGYPPVIGGGPIVPPDTGEPPKPIPNWKAQVIWTAETGWAVILVPQEGALVPTPSSK